jgi:subtilase family serine protease
MKLSPVEKVLMLARVRTLISTSLIFCATAAFGAVSPQRILVPIDGSQVSVLPGNVPSQVQRATDLGRLPGDTALTELSLGFTMTAAQQAELTQLLADQQNPASPRYHQWLTPEQFGAEFGLAQVDLQKVSSWLASQGFTVTQIARGGTFIQFSGTAAQVEAAFNTQLHQVSVDGETHFTNLTSPSLPSAVAALTSGISGLHDFRVKPHLRRPLIGATADTTVVSPHYTSAASGNHFVAPGDFYTIYDENPLLTSGTNGTGIKIAVLGQIDINLSDIATFRSLGGLSPNVPVVTLDGALDPGQPTNDASDLLESELDVEWAGATAPAATVLFYTGRDVFAVSLKNAVNDNTASIISISYGLCESLAQTTSPNFLTAYDPILQQANAQGQTIVVSAGDSGATDCDTGVTATQGLAVDFPGGTPYVTTLGGTMFNDATGTFWGPNNGNAATALSYIPEMPWNEDVVNDGLSSGGGGVSIVFPKPYWQVGTGVPADSSRDVPDVSFNAAVAHDATLICTPGFCTNGTYKDINGNHDIVGGTSVGAPQFAGVMALVVQKTGGRVGNANPTIYALANSALYGTVFHDVTSGSNASPCLAGSTNCPAGGTIGFSAGVGYDLATGWGSVDVTNMVNSWNLVTPTVSTIGQGTSSISLIGTPAAVTQGTNISFTATVTATSGTPTGTVQFLLDNVAQGGSVAITAGTATFSLNTTSIPNGAHTVSAVYSGNTALAGSKATFNVAITSSGVPDFTLTPATSTVTVNPGTSSTGTVFTVTGLNSFTGTVTLSVNSVSGTTLGLSPNTVTLSNTKTVGTSTLTVNAFTINARNSQSASSRTPARPWYGAGSGIALAGILMLMLPKRRRFMGTLVAVISIGLFATSGCGGGGNAGGGGGGTGGSTNTPPGTYTITITASGTSGTTAVTHTATVSLVVP